MAHNIMERDNMFTVRQPAWHGLGTVFEDYPTRQEAQELAHNWEPITEPVYVANPVVTPDGPSVEYERVEEFKAVKRSDTNHTLGVVSDTYTPVTNSEMYDIAEAIEGEAKGSVMFESGGSLKNGSKVWLLIRFRDPLVLKGDESTATIPYYALQNAHDGSGSFRGQATATRIVCDNTAQMADMDARQRGTEFVFRHTKNVGDRIEEAREALAGWRESVENHQRLMEHLIDEPVDRRQAQEFIERFIPLPAEGTYSDRVARNVSTARDQWWDIYRGETISETMRDSRYSLVQTSIEYLNHARKARSDESRFQRAYLTRNVLAEDAMKIAQAV